ncbi:MAG: rhomboid family intramembrane serine protease [candidate division Zixibacteria bacterium]|nr:rhomboid family intramembrane serine protease [candidate division Zixibacteria bacterium]
MVNFNRHNYSSFGLRRAITPGIKWLLIVNGVVYLLQLLVGPKLTLYFGLSPRAILNGFCIWQVVTYMFLHGGFLHILFNMFMLWMFGTDLERQWGTREFLKFYFLTGIGAGIITFLLTISSVGVTIGASGAIFGILVAYAMLYPNRLVYIYFLFPVRVKYLVMFLIGFGVLAAWRGADDGIAHFAHLGGALIAYLYLKQDWRLSRLWRPLRRFTSRRKSKTKLRENRKSAELMSEVDRILDRINELGGYENLSEQEKKILEKASKRLSNKRE